MTFIMPLKRSMSDPGLILRCWSAVHDVDVMRGSATMIVAPLSLAFCTHRETTGWASVKLVPMANMHLEFSRSRRLLVMAPVPKTAPRPTTVGEWQSRAQLSTWGEPSSRANFSKR